MNSFIETLNHWGDHFLNFAWPMLWQSSLLIAIIFVVDFALRRKIRAAIRYALWLVVLVKLLLPPSLALPTSPAWWLPPSPQPPAKPQTTAFAVNYGDQSAFTVPLQSQPAPAPIQPKMSVAAWSLAASCAVSAGLLAWLLFRWRQINQKVRRATASEELIPILHEARRLTHLRPGIRLKLTEDSMSPAVCGLFRPVILLPQTLVEKLSAGQLRAVLLHEAIHLRRGDVWLNCAQALLQICYWWHPLLWLANARIRRAREEAVDDAVMLALRDEAEIYAPTLLEVAKLAFNRPLASLGLVGIMESRSALRQRVERLINFNAPKKAGLTIVSILGILAFSAVALPMGEAPTSTNDPVSAKVDENADQTNSIASTATNSTNDLENKSKAGSLVQDGKLLYEMGKFEDAEAKLNAALVLNPDNQAAHYYLALIEQSRQARTSGGPKLIYPRLDNSLNNLSNRAADAQSEDTMVFRINQPMKEDDLKKHLLNAGVKIPPTVFVFTDAGILLVRGSEEQLNLVERVVQKVNGFSPMVGIGSPVPNPQVTNNDVHTSTGREMIYRKLNSLRLESVSWSNGLPLSEAIRYLAEQSRLLDPDKKGIYFLFNPNMAASTAASGPGAGADAPRLLDPITGLPEMPAAGAAPETVDASAINVTLALNNVTFQQLLDAIVLVADRSIKYSVEDYGVVFSAKPSGPEPPILETRVFKVDPNTFYTALLTNALRNHLNMQTNTILTDAESLFNQLGVDLTTSGRSIAFNDKLGLLFVRATASEMDTLERVIQALNQTAPEIHLKARFMEVPESDVESVLKAGVAVDAKETNTVEILTTTNATVLLRKLESAGGVTALAEPEAETTSGRQVQMRSDNSTVNLHAWLLSDGYTFNLQATVSKPETMNALANIWDGQTLALVSSKSNGTNRLIVFITATVVDTAGKPVHSDDDLPFDPSTIPPQPKISTPSP